MKTLMTILCTINIVLGIIAWANHPESPMFGTYFSAIAGWVVALIAVHTRYE